MATGEGQKPDSEIDRLTCSVCLEPYRQPKLLPCFHTFCSPCLQQLVDRASQSKPRTEQAEGNGDQGSTNEGNHSSFLCPACHKTVDIPPGGVAQFQSNIYLEAESAQTATVYCDVCEENTATHFCVECQQDFCGTCRIFHGRVAATRSHQVEPVGKGKKTRPAQFTPGARKGYCQTHTDQKLVFYCHQCQAAVCLYCKLTSHEGHTTEDMAVAGERIRAEVHQLSLDLDKQIEVTDKVIMKVTEEQKALLQQRQDVLDRAKASADKIMAWVKEAQDELTEQVGRIADPIHEQLQSQMERAVGTKSSMTDIQSRTKAVLERGSHTELVRMKAELVEHETVLKQTNFNEPPVPTYDENTFLEHYADYNKVTKAAIAQFLGEVWAREGYSKIKRSSGVENIKLNKDTTFTIHALCFTTDGLLAGVQDNTGKYFLILLDSQGNTVKSKSVSYQITTVAFIPPNSYFVLYTDNTVMAGFDIEHLQGASVPFTNPILARSRPAGGRSTYCLGRVSERVYEVHEVALDTEGKLSAALVCKLLCRAQPTAFDVSADSKYFVILMPGRQSSTYGQILLYSFPKGEIVRSVQVNVLRDVCFRKLAGREVLQSLSRDKDNYGQLKVYDYANDLREQSSVDIYGAVCLATDGGTVAIACDGAEILLLST